MMNVVLENNVILESIATRTEKRTIVGYPLRVPLNVMAFCVREVQIQNVVLENNVT